MRDELLGYYERELAFVRQMGAEFARKYPKIAGRLQLETDRAEDPHVERLVEAFAFLSGRVHLKLDDDFPEITESFLNVLYPHYLAPVPSMAIVRFATDQKQGGLTSGFEIKSGTYLNSRPVEGTPCRFRTCYPTTLWPLEVASAALESDEPPDMRGVWGAATLRIGLRCLNGTTLAELRGGGPGLPPLDILRFYLHGEPQLVHPLYEMIFNRAEAVELRPAGGRKAGSAAAGSSQPAALPAGAIRPVGFAEDEGMLPYTARSFMGYRLLTEYFAFPNKFMFFDVAGLGRAAREGSIGSEFELVVRLRDVTPPRGKVDASVFQLGCAPIVNLFPDVSEPILLTERQHEYRVLPEVRRQMAMEVYAVNSVTSTDPQLQETRHYQPFYSLRHAYDRDPDRTFWYATRRPSQRPEDPGTEVYLSLVDLKFNPHVPAASVLTVHTTCTNRDLPERLPFGGSEGELEVEGAAPLGRVRCLTKPTATLRPPPRRAAQWRLISHLALNHLSLVEGDGAGAPEALQEILTLYDLQDSPATRKQIAGIARVTARRVVRQTGTRIGAGFVRGVETTVEFDEEQYVGSGLFLFASVLERFLALYASVNSFHQLVAKVRQREGILKQWPPNAGEQILL